MSKVRKVGTHGKFGLNLFLELYALKDYRGNPKVFTVSIDEIDINNTYNYRYLLYINCSVTVTYIRNSDVRIFSQEEFLKMKNSILEKGWSLKQIAIIIFNPEIKKYCVIDGRNRVSIIKDYSEFIKNKNI